MNNLTRLTFITVAFLVSLSGVAEEVKLSPAESVLEQSKKLEKIQKVKDMSLSDLGDLHSKLSKLKTGSTQCITEYEKQIKEKKAALEVLGEKHKKESPELINQRKQQQKDLAEAEKGLATCSAVSLQAQSDIALIESEIQALLARQLLAHGDSINDVIEKLEEVPGNWYEQSWTKLRKNSWFQNASSNQIWTVFVIALFGVAIGLIVRRFVSPLIIHTSWSEEKSSRFAASVSSSFCHDAPYLLGSLALVLSFEAFTATAKHDFVMMYISYWLFFLFVAFFVIRFSLQPIKPGKLFLNIQPDVAGALGRHLKILSAIALFGYLLVETPIRPSLPDPLFHLLRSIVRIAFAVNLIWILGLFANLRGILNQSWMRYGLSLVLVVAVLADLTGYTNLSGWLLRSVFGSLLVIVVILILANLTSDLLEGLEYGHTTWQRNLRRILGFTPEGHITGFFWFRLLVNLGWLSVLVLFLVFIWDVSSSAMDDIWTVFFQGFQVGSLKVVPGRIVLALVSLGLLVALSAWFQGQMRKRWVNKMPMERGAREAMVTMIGYIGVAIAILITLGVSGIDYSNLAIIAGALSLGIGFGLQNIVNNFVSGLILLFERPVKTGDWVVVGNTEGYVKRIRIRATEIQTFDRADVIVPNSELISGQVTNWMLRDTRGRARVPVSVAYGSDTQKVKEVLLEVASQNSQVITEISSMAPRVLFREFGDSSLNFELRCFIRNIDERLNVVSDLNFAIDAAFRENGIEIPFPQRDLHVKQWPDNGPDSSK